MKLMHVLSQGLLVAVLTGLTPWGALYAEGPTNTRAVVHTAMNETEAEIYKAGGFGRALSPKYRQEMAPKITPLLKKQNDLIEELVKIEKNDPTVDVSRQIRNMALLSALGDETATKSLDTVAKSSNPEHAFYGKAALALRDWWNASDDPEAQEKVYDTVHGLGKLAPQNDSLSRVVDLMKDYGPATPELKEKCHDMLMKDLTSPRAKQYQNWPRIDQPLTFATQTLTGQALDGQKIKGKVTLFQVWSPTAEGGRRDLAAIATLHEKYTAKGLQIIGVVHEPKLENLTSFQNLNKDKKVTWPQIYDPQHPLSNPLAGRLAVQRTPWIAVFDRDGLLRYNSAEPGKLDELIATLLEEKVGESAKRVAEKEAARKKDIVEKTKLIKDKAKVSKEIGTATTRP